MFIKLLNLTLKLIDIFKISLIFIFHLPISVSFMDFNKAIMDGAAHIVLLRFLLWLIGSVLELI